MAEFHFVEDYEKMVKKLIKSMPIDQAMSAAVGGSYETVGRVEFAILQHNGLKRGDVLVDLGCGSGRLASTLASNWDGDYLGLDIVQALLNYAKNRCPKHFRFVLNRKRSIPVDDNTVDIFCAFSVFTHLLHEESYLYLREMYRGLKTGGRVVFSFLEFRIASHWAIFEATIGDAMNSTRPHLNQFIERNQIETWARHLGFTVAGFVDGDAAPWPSGEPLGQSVVVLIK